MSNTAQLSTDDIDDLIYACRTDDLEYLREIIPKLASQLKVSEAEIIRSAIDVDEEGLGSRACLLHYPAANGKAEMLNFLLSALGRTAQSNGISNGHTSPSLVNHQNVSGNTPLHWAALNGHLEIVKALVKMGADPTIVNEAGRDAVVEAEYSSQPGAEDCATWMLKECDALESGTGGAAATEAQASSEDTEGVDAEAVCGESSRAATNGDAKEG